MSRAAQARWRSVAAVATMSAVFGCVACGTSGTTNQAQGTPSPSASTGSVTSPTAAATSSSPSASTSASASASATASASASEQATVRTAAQLKKGLLALSDLPSGFAVDSSGSGDDGMAVTSTKSQCAALVRLLNAKQLPGSKVEVDRSYSGGSNGPYLDETLDALGTKRAAGQFLAGYRSAVRACHSVKITVSGAGSSTVTVREISFAKLGDDTFAARLQASGGALDGFDLIQVGVQSGDLVLGMTLIGLEGPDAEDATRDAVGKIEKTFGTSQSI